MARNPARPFDLDWQKGSHLLSYQSLSSGSSTGLVGVIFESM